MRRSRGCEDSVVNAWRAVIAEDEPVLSRTLQRLLFEAWPELKIAGVADDGMKAIELAQTLVPDVMFLDIKMPGKTGLEVAEAVADEWPDDKAEPLFVFITAYDNFAISAFEHAAMDYMLKPATLERLEVCVQRLKQRLHERARIPAAGGMAALMQRVQSITDAADAPEKIKILRAGVGNTVRMIPVSEVICLEAAEKYVNVVTADGEALVRMSLRDLVSRLDAADFTQVHRGVLVNMHCIVSATRDENGRYRLCVRGLQRSL
jgi:DNA-binding LytR/AlgR family response regulator